MNSEDNSIEGFILTGGASSRMGFDKATLRFENKSFIEHLSEAVFAVTERRVKLIGGFHENVCDLPVLPDEVISSESELRRGPIVGLLTALRHAKSEWVFIVACDLPFVTEELIRRMASFRSKTHDAVVPMQPDGNMQPLCGFYRRKACLPFVESAIAKRDYKMGKLVSSIRTRFVEPNEVADLAGSSSFFFNINRIEDYKTALDLNRTKH